MTLRRQIIQLLTAGEMTAGDLSRTVGIREREVCDHLAHIERSVASRGKRLTVLPAVCLSCGYVFKDRRRLTRPSRCPQCRRTHLSSPAYRIRAS